MKRSIALVTAIITAAAAVCLTGCVSVSEKYADADKYSAGNANFNGSDVQSIYIDWSSGDVTVTRHDTDTVTVTETSKEDLKDSQKVHTWLDGDTLRVHYCKSGETFIGFRSIEKNLEIQIPQDMELYTLSYDGSSGDSLFEEITAETISVDVSSGDTRIIGCSAKKFEAETSSGDITIEQKGEAESISAEATSGDIEISAEKAAEVEMEATSGHIELAAQEAKSVDAETTSGNIVLRFGKMPADTDVDATSGNIKVYVPEGADFTADIDTTSGDFDSNIALSKSGSKYTSGNGSNTLDIETTSGDIKILSE